jgi:hypothetical protein
LIFFLLNPYTSSTVTRVFSQEVGNKSDLLPVVLI